MGLKGGNGNVYGLRVNGRLRQFKGPKGLKGLTSPRINGTVGPKDLTRLKGRWQGSEKA